jgi:hypothetical protein
VRSAVDWFLRLNLVQKALAVLVAALLLFSSVFFLTTVVLYLSNGDKSNSPVENDNAANSPSPGSSSASANATTPVPDFSVRISSARWEGEKAVVEGTWKGDISSIHCDLLEGGSLGKSTRWWDRSVAARMDWSSRTFTQQFVAVEGGGEPLDPGARYGVECSAVFSGGWSLGAEARVEGAPPVRR